MTLAYQGAKAVQTGFRSPSDDWAPMLLFTTHEGRQHIVGTPHTRQRKEETAQAVTALLQRAHAVEALWLSSAWQVIPDATDADLSAIRPSQDPRRREILILVHVGADFTAVHRAPIRRHDDRTPTLGALTESHCRIDGLMSTALRRGIE
ncbi:hypothetical protein LIX17_25130 (plasmid) [Mycobacterium avium subsp. hominissuis]|uniref:hypothetical protein n=1 Tax=Mycobacterium avium TaxID=1764 RepID=UPI0031404618